MPLCAHSPFIRRFKVNRSSVEIVPRLARITNAPLHQTNQPNAGADFSRALLVFSALPCGLKDCRNLWLV